MEKCSSCISINKIKNINYSLENDVSDIDKSSEELFNKAYFAMLKEINNYNSMSRKDYSNNNKNMETYTNFDVDSIINKALKEADNSNNIRDGNDNRDTKINAFNDDVHLNDIINFSFNNKTGANEFLFNNNIRNNELLNLYERKEIKDKTHNSNIYSDIKKKTNNEVRGLAYNKKSLKQDNLRNNNPIKEDIKNEELAFILNKERNDDVINKEKDIDKLLYKERGYLSDINKNIFPLEKNYTNVIDSNNTKNLVEKNNSTSNIIDSKLALRKNTNKLNEKNNQEASFEVNDYIKTNDMIISKNTSSNTDISQDSKTEYKKKDVKKQYQDNQTITKDDIEYSEKSFNKMLLYNIKKEFKLLQANLEKYSLNINEIISNIFELKSTSKNIVNTSSKINTTKNSNITSSISTSKEPDYIKLKSILTSFHKQFYSMYDEEIKNSNKNNKGKNSLVPNNSSADYNVDDLEVKLDIMRMIYSLFQITYDELEIKANNELDNLSLKLKDFEESKRNIDISTIIKKHNIIDDGLNNKIKKNNIDSNNDKDPDFSFLQRKIKNKSIRPSNYKKQMEERSTKKINKQKQNKGKGKVRGLRKERVMTSQSNNGRLNKSNRKKYNLVLANINKTFRKKYNRS